MHTYSARTEAMTHPEHCTDRRTGAARRKGTPWSLHYSTSAHRARHRGEDRPSRAHTAAGPARSSLDDVTARTKRVAHMATSICQEQRLVDFVEAAPEGVLRRLPELQFDSLFVPPFILKSSALRFRSCCSTSDYMNTSSVKLEESSCRGAARRANMARMHTQRGACGACPSPANRGGRCLKVSGLAYLYCTGCTC